MRRQTINLIKKQIDVYVELDKATQLIEPVVATGKKLTKREVNKANEMLLKEFGLLGKHKVAKITCYLSREFSFRKLIIFNQDRSIRDEADSNGYCSTSYVTDYTKTIYLDDELGSITLDKYRDYYANPKQMTVKQIQASIDKFKALEEKRKKLEDEQRELDYYYLIKEAC